MKHIKRLLAAALTLGMTLLSLTACDSGGDTASDRQHEEQTADAAPSANGAEYEPVNFVLGHVGAASDVNLLQRFAEKFKNDVEEKSHGQVTIEIHPGGELGGERDLVEGVQLGTIDMALSSSNVLGNFVSDVFAFDFPFLFKDEAHAARVFDGDIGKEMRQKVIAASGINVLVWPSNGARQMMNSKRPVTKAADLKGIKIRTAENKIHMALFSALGAAPTPIGAPELYTSLQQGVVDAMEGTLTWIVPAKYYEVQPYVSMTSHLYAPSILAMNDDSFQALPENTRTLLQECAETARDYQRDYVTNADEDMIKILEENGIQVTRAEDIDRQSFVAATQVVYDELGADYKEIIDRIKALENE